MARKPTGAVVEHTGRDGGADHGRAVFAVRGSDANPFVHAL
jgi:hypothetical protein